MKTPLHFKLPIRTESQCHHPLKHKASHGLHWFLVFVMLVSVTSKFSSCSTSMLLSCPDEKALQQSVPWQLLQADTQFRPCLRHEHRADEQLPLHLHRTTFKMSSGAMSWSSCTGTSRLDCSSHPQSVGLICASSNVCHITDCK